MEEEAGRGKRMKEEEENGRKSLKDEDGRGWESSGK